MYEPWKVTKKDGFANFDHAYTMYTRGVFENDIYTKFITDLHMLKVDSKRSINRSRL